VGAPTVTVVPDAELPCFAELWAATNKAPIAAITHHTVFPKEILLSFFSSYLLMFPITPEMPVTTPIGTPPLDGPIGPGPFGNF